MAKQALKYEELERNNYSADPQLVDLALEKLRQEDRLNEIWDNESHKEEADELYKSTRAIVDEAMNIVPDGEKGIIAILSMIHDDGSAREAMRDGCWQTRLAGLASLYALSVIRNGKPHPIARMARTVIEPDFCKGADSEFITIWIEGCETGIQLPGDTSIDAAFNAARQLEQDHMQRLDV